MKQLLVKTRTALINRLHAPYVQAGETGLKKKDLAAAFIAYIGDGERFDGWGGGELRGADAGTRLFRGYGPVWATGRLPDVEEYLLYSRHGR